MVNPPKLWINILWTVPAWSCRNNKRLLRNSSYDSFNVLNQCIAKGYDYICTVDHRHMYVNQYPGY